MKEDESEPLAVTGKVNEEAISTGDVEALSATDENIDVHTQDTKNIFQPIEDQQKYGLEEDAAEQYEVQLSSKDEQEYDLTDDQKEKYVEQQVESSGDSSSSKVTQPLSTNTTQSKEDDHSVSVWSALLQSNRFYACVNLICSIITLCSAFTYVDNGSGQSEISLIQGFQI